MELSEYIWGESERSLYSHLTAMASQLVQLLANKSFMSCGHVNWRSYCWRLLLLMAFLPNVTLSGRIVEYLPGFDGELPFKLETGYTSVGDSELFYYFIESQGDPQKDPIFLWLTGGPGCSSFSGIIYEIGPMEFDINNYKGGLPKLKYYPYAWTRTASFIFLDAPVGTGFSYSTTPQGWPTSDSESAEQSYQFLRKWLLEHPQYLLVQLFIGGDSYSGLIVPLITQKVVEANEAMVNPYLNLKGFLLGSPTTDQILNANSKIIFAHRMALISDQLYEKLKMSCNESYVDVDPSNTACVAALGAYEICIKDLYANDILEPSCVFASESENPPTGQRSAKENPTNFILSPPRIPDLWCRNFNYVLSYVWANNPQVQDALHVRKGTVSTWQRCNLTLSYTEDVRSVIDVHRYLSSKSLELLVQTNSNMDNISEFDNF
ncbi:hypothetical protein MANES_10G085800v8 [Manihot esculenta]|uniref:Uncharacterized protein n=1 Tax=Manihot esculenta TaxID=3983 RepID=A0ACB7GZ51_MANES|nr:hypothetical protein MANES_10G085800v8 [Manihot esculenta]